MTNDNDKEIFSLIKESDDFLADSICLVGSGNASSPQVKKVLSSGLSNSVVEGYIGKRYHAGCGIFDKIENIAIERCKELFGAKSANVQPHSGSQANQAVMLGILKKGDTILSLSISGGGHITHNKVSFLSELFNIHNYSVDPKTYVLDYDNIEKIAKEIKPQLIICGASSYPREIEFSKFRKIADSVGAYLLADIAHTSGIIAAKLHESPVNIADVTTSSTYKTIRGPHGGMIIYGNNSSDELIKKVNNALIPQLQSASHTSHIAAKAVCFYEALTPEFIEYQKKILLNSRAIVETLLDEGVKIISDGTDNHLAMIDLRETKCNGKDLEEYLESIKILTNKNLIPFDKANPNKPTGLRVGTSTFTTIGFNEDEAKDVAKIIAFVINNWGEIDADMKNDLLDKVNKIIKTKKMRED